MRQNRATGLDSQSQGTVPGSRPTGVLAMAALAVLYAITSLVQGPAPPDLQTGGPQVRAGPLLLSRPLVATGDSPHYLVMVHSMVHDGDLDLANNCGRALHGGWDAGARFRGRPLDRHVERDVEGRQRSLHSPFLPMLLAALVWPLRGSPWVESACIWTTLLAAWGGLALLGSAGAALVAIVAVVQFLFADMDRWGLFHLGGHSVFRPDAAGLVRMFVDPVKGLLWFSPFLAWGLWECRTSVEKWLPALAYVAVHAAAGVWHGGIGFSNRYLVPVLPAAMPASGPAAPRGFLFRAAAAYSLAWGTLAGMVPFSAFDLAPWEIIPHLLRGAGITPG